MGMVIFGILFLVGFLLSMASNLTNVVQAFQESVTWGLVVFFVPFAIFVFVVKFWQKKWVSRVFLMGIGGALLSVGSVVGLVVSMPEHVRDGVFASEGYYEGTWESEGYQSYETQSFNAEAAYEPFGEGVRFATAASEQAQTAQTTLEWTEVANNWDYAIAMMESVPPEHPQFALAQQKVEEYGRNFSYASQNAQ